MGEQSISLWALIWSQAAAPLLMVALTPMLYALPSLLFKRVSFECADGSSRLAMQYILTHIAGAANWSVYNGMSIPVGHIMCIRPLCWAHVTFKVGQPRWGEEHSTDVVMFWPRWMAFPTNLVPELDVPATLVDGCVKLNIMKKLGSDYCAWEVDEVDFHIDNCPDAASVAASSMLGVLLLKPNNGHVFYVNGPTGTGKTTSAIILAHKLAGRFVEYDFTNSGSKFEKLIKDSKPSKERPLIVSVSEADKKIEQVACLEGNGKAKRLSDKRDVYDKHSLFKLMDEVNYQRKNVILVMSGNTPFQKLERNLNDPSFTRETRMTVLNVGGDLENERGRTPYIPTPLLSLVLDTSSYDHYTDSESFSCDTEDDDSFTECNEFDDVSDME